MLTFNLKKEWYEKIASGEKRIECREVKPYWTKRIENELGEEQYGELARSNKVTFGILNSISCVLRLGYTKKYLNAEITQIRIKNGKDTDLKIDKPVYAIHLSDIKEVV